MNTRERFNQIMNFATSDHTLKWEWAYWRETIQRWGKEGLPVSENNFEDTVKSNIFHSHSNTFHGEAYLTAQNELQDKDVHDFFGLDPGIVKIPINLFFSPSFKEKVLAEEENTLIIRDSDGIKKRVFKDRPGMPQFLKYPVEKREDFERVKERLDPEDKERFPSNWDTLISQYQNRDFSLAIGGIPVGFFGVLDNLIGVQKLSYMYYDDSDLVRDILHFITDFWISLFSKVLSQVDVDYGHFWEDMAYKTGPLVSPSIFLEFMLPCYKRIISVLKDFGIDKFFVDSDGNLWKIIPLFLEVGITGIFPLEVAAGMDVVELRKNFPKLQMIGGIDKRCIAKGKKEIDEELTRVFPAIGKGGYIPCIDHSVPPNISWDNFSYYRRRLNRLIEKS